MLEALLDNNENLTPSNIATAFKTLDEKNNEEAKAMMQVMVGKTGKITLNMNNISGYHTDYYFMTLLTTIQNNVDLRNNAITNSLNNDLIKTALTNATNEYANKILTTTCLNSTIHYILPNNLTSVNLGVSQIAS